ncbi:MAG: zinc ribbon domain-containing protein [Saccharofermentans sp.]|nr:zinc ribbon domain-containing protein [Saccharofermentans sp.]
MYCSRCGRELPAGAAYCQYCTDAAVNTPVIISSQQNAIAADPMAELIPYTGQDRFFPFFGHQVCFSSGMDAYIHYRKAFKHAAKYMMQYVMRDWNMNVKDLDSYFSNFPIMYIHYRRYLIDAAIKIAVSHNIFDISRDELEEEMAVDFSRCNELYDVLIDAFNATIELNQARKAHQANMLPGIIFGGGILGFVQAYALNVATDAVVSASIRNANVTRAQRAELFRRIDPQALAKDVYYDYWCVHYSLTFRLNENGINVWYPTPEGNSKALGLMTNLQDGLVPQDKIIPVLCQILFARPMQTGCMDYIIQRFGYTPEVVQLMNYLGYEDEMGV